MTIKVILGQSEMENDTKCALDDSFNMLRSESERGRNNDLARI